MLTSTFCHIKGLSRLSEKCLWSKGVLAWNHLDSCTPPAFSPNKMRSVKVQIEESKKALQDANTGFFLDRLPSADIPRVYPHITGKIGYLDIETTGLDAWSQITTIALYDGVEVRTFVRGVNLGDFPHAISACSMVSTYNGSRFDLPFIRKEFGIPMEMPHLDLMRPLRAHGYKGGLKVCERLLGIRRQIPEDIDGYEAVRLWHAHQRGYRTALPKLLAYNTQDVLSLELILILTYNLSMKGFPLLHELPLPRQPHIHWPGE